jgi:peptidoglycan lytic transglycosylase D
MAPLISNQALTFSPKMVHYKIAPSTHFPRFYCLRSSLFFFFLWLSATLPATSFASEAFPRYPVIENNVRFWEKVYHHYSTSQAVVHDSYDLSKIYAILPIFDHRIPGASRINAPIFKDAEKKYSGILNKLAKGITSRSDDEKRIAAMFHMHTKKQLQQAANSIRIQIGQKERFLEGFIRSGTYLSAIRKIFRDQGLPEELAYLPHVESSFNLKAYSKFGASGIWQFTRSTGSQFLTINSEIDERQDPILASQAAAQFLKKNYLLLGNWPLALTAYNYGPAGMLRAQKANTSYEKIFSNYNQGYFKFASRNFYSEFLASLSVAKKLEKDPSLTLNKPQQLLTIKLPGYIAINDLCSHFNVSPSTIKVLNPALRSSVLKGDRYVPQGYTLRLPQSRQQKKLLATLPQHLYHKKQMPTKFYQVRPGDTAGKIAFTHGVSLKTLGLANKLDTKASVFVGQNLRIPEQTKKNRLAKIQHISSTEQKRTVSTLTRAFTASKPQSIPVLIGTKKKEAVWKSIQNAHGVVLGELSVRNRSPKNKGIQGTITVLPEESMELLANWLQIPSKELHKINKLPSDHKLLPDETIHIPLTRVSASEFEEKRLDFHLETEGDFYSAYKITGIRVYEVNKGDTIWGICRTKFDLPFWLLKKYNTTLDFNILRSSQQLTIPVVKAI